MTRILRIFTDLTITILMKNYNTSNRQIRIHSLDLRHPCSIASPQFSIFKIHSLINSTPSSCTIRRPSSGIIAAGSIEPIR